MDIDRGATRPLGIVGVGDRCSEQGHYGVADVFVYGAAVGLDDAVDGGKETAQHIVRFLWIVGAGELRKARQVGEQDGHLAALGFGRMCGFRGLVGRRARVAEPRAATAAKGIFGLVGEAAGLASDTERRTTLGAEAATLAVVVFTRRAPHRAPANSRGS